MANGVNREHGPYRRPMGGSRTVVSSQTTSRWARATVARHACGTERSLLGATHGCSLARPAVSLSVLSNMSSALPTLAAQWASDAPAAKTGRGLTGPREARSERILHRRQFQRREKRGPSVGPTKHGKGSESMAIADGHGFPLAVHVASASPHETKLVEPTLEQPFLLEAPQRMIGDRAYDSDPLDQRIHQRYGVQLIAPHKFVRVAAATQDGRVLPRYPPRWKVEPLFAWLHNFRRTVSPWEYNPENFLPLLKLPCRRTPPTHCS